MSKLDKSCETCACGIMFTHNNINMIECHRYPPQSYPTNGNFYFPHTKPNDFCFEYKEEV